MSSAGAATNRKMMQYRGQPYGGGEDAPYYHGPPPPGPPPPPYYAPEASRGGAGPPPGYGGPPPPYAGAGPPAPYIMQHGGPGTMPPPSRQGHPLEAWYGGRCSPLNSPWQPPQGNSYPPSMGPLQAPSRYSKHPRYAEPMQGAYRGLAPEPGDRRNLPYPPPPNMRYLQARSYDAEEEMKPPKERRPPTPTLKDSVDDGSVEEKDAEESEKDDEKKKDALSLLAKVSSAMAPPKSRKQQKKQGASTSKQQTSKAPSKKSAPPRDTDSPPPPRGVPRLRPSPIMTPNTASTRQMVASAKSGAIDPKPITPITGGGGNVVGGYQYRHHSGVPRPYPPAYPPTHEESRFQGPPPRYSYPPSSPYFAGPNGRGDWGRGDGRYPPGYPSSPPTPGGPAVVERTSFDSTEGPPPTPHITSGGPQERRFFSEPESYWYGREGGPSYPPPRWTGPPVAADLPPPPPPPPVGYMSYYPPPPGGDYPDPSGRYTPPDGRSGYAAYGYVQQPSLETKTVLKKKFSWKHYPELERFLIENRDDYLEHSSRNYTVAQKQFNNHLTERLLEVADENGYAFDADDFNFVAIRDRIRCYYKSFVQTMKKRGLPLPGTLGTLKKKPKLEENEEEAQEGETKDENAKQDETVNEKRDDLEETEHKTSSGSEK